jgi:hypothetical protein
MVALLSTTLHNSTRQIRTQTQKITIHVASFAMTFLPGSRAVESGRRCCSAGANLQHAILAQEMSAAM